MKHPESEIIKLFREAYEPCAREEAENPRKASRQSDVSREKELREAVKECRRRWQEDDRRSRRDLARSQMDLACFLHDHAARPEAEKLFCRALTQYEELSRHGSQGAADWARALGQGARLLQEAGQAPAAETLFRKRLSILRDLARQNPQRYGPRAADGMEDLAESLLERDDFQQAENLYRERLQLYRDLEKGTIPSPSMGRAINDLARLIESRSPREAEDLYQEAFAREMALTSRHPGYGRYLARTLRRLVALQMENGRAAAAEKTLREAVPLQRTLTKWDLTAGGPPLVLSLRQLAALLEDWDRDDEAQACYEEALTLCRKLAQTFPAEYEADLADLLAQARPMLGYLRPRREEELFQEERAARYRLADRYFAYEADLAECLTRRAEFLTAQGRLSRAEDLFREALEVRRRQARRRPAAWTEEWAAARDRLASFLESLGRSQEAAQLRQKTP